MIVKNLIKIYIILVSLRVFQSLNLIKCVVKQTVQIKYPFKLSKYAMQWCTMETVSSLSNLK